MDQQFENGLTVGQKHFAQIQAKGSRWISRHVPAYIREHLMVPYYFAPGTVPGLLYLWVIQTPIAEDEKVHFLRFAELHEKDIAQIPPRPK
ncbi:hypothetical protein [Fibrella aquatica]|uniref:hypothetical protein n=1 Tax=Fibrella aquatica TaxID=3242487 RepID=UPI00351FF533